MKRCLVTLLPTPDAATFIQNRFKTEGHVKKWPLVRGPKQADTKGSTTPMCNSMGAFVSFYTSSWYLYTHSGRWFIQLNVMLLALSYSIPEVKLDAMSASDNFYYRMQQ